MFSALFDVDVNTIPKKFQPDLIEMLCNYELKKKFLQRAYRCLNFTKSTFLKVVLIPARLTAQKKWASMFDGKYPCEQMFSAIKYMKSKLRSRISSVHLEMLCFLHHPTCLQILKNFHKTSSIKCHINVVLLKCE